MNLLKELTQSMSKTLLNPFKKEKIYAIHLHIYPNSFRYVATISFENGRTKGEQEIQSKDFNTLIDEVYKFIESLED